MIGTLINFASIVIGSIFGLLVGSKLQERIKETVIAGFGLFTLGYGLQMFLQTRNALIVLGSLLLGGIIGEIIQIEDGMQNIGRWLQERYARLGGETNQIRFVSGFFSASILFCVGPMAILGSIEDGLTGNYQTLAIKSILDGFASIAFASSLGIGVIFSAIPVLIYQGAITLLAFQVQAIFTAPMMTEMTAAGGVILMAIAVSSLLGIRKIRAGNFLPTLIIAPLLSAFLPGL